MARLIKHLLTPAWIARRDFPASVIVAIEAEIKKSEAQHAGEIRFVVEAALDFFPLLRNQSARERAIDVFSQLRLWDTEGNNGVLIYLLLADRDVEIIADRGINSRVGTDTWEGICKSMETALSHGDFEKGIIIGIQQITALLVQHFPALAENQNELPDRPIVR